MILLEEFKMILLEESAFTRQTLSGLWFFALKYGTAFGSFILRHLQNGGMKGSARGSIFPGEGMSNPRGSELGGILRVI